MDEITQSMSHLQLGEGKHDMSHAEMFYAFETASFMDEITQSMSHLQLGEGKHDMSHAEMFYAFETASSEK
jgi:hypothetical protein